MMTKESASGPAAAAAATANAASSAESSAREALLAVALDLFSRRGYADTSVREIVGGAGVTPPTLYYHFRNKEGLYSHLAENCSERFGDALSRAATAGGNTPERLSAITRAHFEFVRQQTAAARFVYGVAFGPREHLGFVDHAQLMDRLLGPVRRILEMNGAAKGHDVGDLALSFTGMLCASVQRFLGGQADAIGPRRADQIVELFLYGTSGSGGARARK